mgnify:CR=1 FL=1
MSAPDRPYADLIRALSNLRPDDAADALDAITRIAAQHPTWRADHRGAFALGWVKSTLRDIALDTGVPAPCTCGADLSEHDLTGCCDRTGCDGWRRVA